MQSVLEFGQDRSIRFPDDSQRIVIVGMTGSGKTHAGMWHLSRRSYHVKPWVVYDFKEDEFINSIPGVQYWDVSAPAPSHPGIYIVQPDPDEDSDAIEAQMRDIWKQGDTGIFVDEGYLLKRTNTAFNRILTTGRSRRVPVIICSQRPVWVRREVFTESEFKQIFRLQSVDDVKTMQDSIGTSNQMQWPQPRFYSWYYNGVDDQLKRLKQLPDQDVIRRVFMSKLSKLREVV